MKKIVYIMGRGHSGSTVLDAILGNIHTVVGVGELVSGWNRYNGKCSCGETVLDCPFWGDVRRVFDANAAVGWKQAGDVAAMQANILRLPRTLIRREPYPGLISTTDHCYKSILDVSGAECVVDSGKEYTRAIFLLRNFPETRIVFLVRRCDAVMASIRSRILDGTGFQMLRMRFTNRMMAPLFVVIAGLNWLIGNFIGEAVALAFKGRVFLVKYEDLCETPVSTIEGIAEFIGVDASRVTCAIEEGNILETGHKIAGNRMRDTNSFIFKPELSKSKKMPFYLRAIGYALGFPLLLKYGYITWQKNPKRESQI